MVSSRLSLLQRAAVALFGVAFAIGAVVPRAALGDRNSCRWRRLDAGSTAPTARRYMAFVYDQHNHRVVMHGGEPGPGGQAPDYGEVWLLELGPENSVPSWVRIEPAFDPVFGAPAGRYGHAAAFVPGESGSPGRMIFHGGKSASGELLDDTWELSLGAAPRWKRLSADALPTNRWLHTGVYFNGAFHIFGGNPAGGMADLWKLDLTNDTWAHLGGPATIACRPGEDRSGTPEWPDRRYYHSHIVDTQRNKMVVYGGDYESACVASNMYETGSGIGPGCEQVPSTTGTWTKTLSEGTQGNGFSRILHGAVYDPMGQRMITVGGFNPVMKGGCLEGALNTVAAITLPPSGSTWYELDPAGARPSGLAGHGIVYDSRADRVIVFGGVTGDVWNGPFTNEVWALEFDLVAPGKVADLDVQQVLPNGAILRWTAPGDDQTTGTAFRYEIRYSASPILGEAGFAAATPWAAPPAPAAPGQENTVFIPSDPGPVYVALKTWDESNNASLVSNMTCFDTSVMTYCDNLILLGVDSADERGPGALELRKISPNPSAGSINVEFHLARRGDAALEVVDLAGRRVAVRDLDDLGPGQHSIVLGRDATLPPGYYLIRLREAGSSVTRPVIVR